MTRLTVDEIVARALRAVREAGLLPERKIAKPAGPQHGPRHCPQRRPRKRVLKGPRARQPLGSGKHPRGITTLLRRASTVDNEEKLGCAAWTGSGAPE